MKKSFEEFLKDLKKVSGPRKHKVTKSSGMAAAFAFYRSNRPKGRDFALSRCQFDKIISDMNLLVIDELLKNKSFSLPASLGKIRVVKSTTKTFIDENGNLVCTKPVNAQETYKLWFEDKDAFEKKTLVRHEVDEIFKITHSISKTKVCKNMHYFKINFSRSIKAIVRDAINKDNFDTYEQAKFHKHKSRLR